MPHERGALGEDGGQHSRLHQDLVGEEARRHQLGAQETGIAAAGRRAGGGYQGGPRHHPAAGDDTQKAQVMDGAGGHGPGIGRVGFDQPPGRPGQRVGAAGEAGADGRDVVPLGGGQFPVQLADHGDEGVRAGALVARHLASHQVVGLDAVGSLVDGGDAPVAQMLGGAGLFHVAHAAVDLDAGVGDLDSGVRAPCLDHGGQQVDQGLTLAAHLFVLVALGHVQACGDEIRQGADGLGLRPHGEQHAAHVRVVDDGDGVRVAAAQRPALDAFQGECAGLLVGPLGDGHALQADAQAGGVHHGEHAFDAAVLLAHQVADGAVAVAVGHDGGGAGVDAQLVLDGDAAHVVALAQGPVRAGEELRDDEKRYALDPGRRAFDAGQHHVDDVAGQVVLAVGDEDLLSADAVVIAVGDRLGAHLRQVGAGLRFGKRHGAAPLAGDHLGQEERFVFRRSVGGDQLHRARGEHGTNAEGHVGRLPDLGNGGGHQPGQPLAAVFGIEGHAVPPAVDETGVGVGEAVGGAHDSVLEHAALPVTGLVEGGQHFAAELRRLLQDGVHQIGRRVGAAGQGGDGIEPGQLVDDEAHVGQRCGIRGHGLWASGKGSGRTRPQGPSINRRSLPKKLDDRGKGRGSNDDAAQANG